MTQKFSDIFSRLAAAITIIVIAGLLMSCSSGGDEAAESNSKLKTTPQQVSNTGSSADGTSAPGFTRPDLKGNMVDFADYSGQVVLVDFWATWCPPCRRSIPILVDLHQQYSDQGFAVLGVSLDTKGPEVVAQFADNFRIPYPIVMGDQKMAQEWNLGRSIPTAFLVDRQGQVVDKVVGFKSKDYYENLIKQYL